MFYLFVKEDIYKVLKKELGLDIKDDLKENNNLSLKKVGNTLKILVEKDNKKIYVLNIEGERKLNEQVKILLKDRQIEEIDKIIFIMDADYKKNENNENDESGYLRTKKAINYAINIIKNNQEVDKEFIFDYYIMPDNENDGMTETLLFEALNFPKIKKYINDEVFPKLKNCDESDIKNKDKSKFMMLAATQNPMEGYAISFLMSSYNKLNKENTELKKFIEFIKKTIN